MKKSILFAIVAGVLLAGCGSKDEAAAPEAPNAEGQSKAAGGQGAEAATKKGTIDLGQ